MAREMGLGVIPWSPLASGVLTGTYTRADLEQVSSAAAAGTGKNVALANGSLTPRALDIAEVVGEIAKEAGKSPAQIALAWTLLNPAVTAPIIGARTLKQLEDNLGALDVQLSDDQRARLDQASKIELGFPHDFLQRPLTRAVAFGEVRIDRRR